MAAPVADRGLANHEEPNGAAPVAMLKSSQRKAAKTAALTENVNGTFLLLICWLVYTETHRRMFTFAYT